LSFAKCRSGTIGDSVVTVPISVYAPSPSPRVEVDAQFTNASGEIHKYELQWTASVAEDFQVQLAFDEVLVRSTSRAWTDVFPASFTQLAHYERPPTNPFFTNTAADTATLDALLPQRALNEIAVTSPFALWIGVAGTVKVANVQSNYMCLMFDTMSNCVQWQGQLLSFDILRN
jgi:hypothetical protein